MSQPAEGQVYGTTTQQQLGLIFDLLVISYLLRQIIGGYLFYREMKLLLRILGKADFNFMGDLIGLLQKEVKSILVDYIFSRQINTQKLKKMRERCIVTELTWTKPIWRFRNKRRLVKEFNFPAKIKNCFSSERFDKSEIHNVLTTNHVSNNKLTSINFQLYKQVGAHSQNLTMYFQHLHR